MSDSDYVEVPGSSETEGAQPHQETAGTAQGVRWPDPIMNFLVAYDIADPQRLRDVATDLERVARRVQKSVFVFTGSRKQLEGVIAGLVHKIDPSCDRIQAWPIRTSTRAVRVDAGAGLPERGVALIVTDTYWRLIEAIDDAGEGDHEPFILE